ncbi:MAG: amino acid ABC transporter substrate-binding protein [Deltaproteobacteria bacterium]|nr:amino acid ABC transporter substrate-binding protein [Deltaproteobacteria bacterium]
MREPALHRFFLLSLTVLMFTAFLQPAASADEIVVGIPLGLSGPHEVIGRMARDAYLLGMEDVNSHGGINGVDLRLDIRDTMGRVGMARGIVRHFIKDKQYPVVMGGLGSIVTREIASRCETQGVPYLAVSGADDSITRRGYRYVFRLNPTFSMYADGITGFLRGAVQPGRIAVVGERTAYSAGISDSLVSAGKDAGWIIGRFEYDVGGGIPLDYIGRIEVFDPDVVVIFTYPKEATFIMEAVKEKMPGIKAFIDGLPSPSGPGLFRVGAGPWDGLFTLTIWSPRLQFPGAESFFQKYLTRFGVEPDYHAAEAYAAVQVLAAALSAAGTLSPEEVRDAFARIRLTTIFGPVFFQSIDGYQNQNILPTFMGQWLDGRDEIVWPPENKTADFILGSSFPSQSNTL